jgi:hypothetical protein
MRNYQKGEVILTSLGRLYRLTETPCCGAPWLACESLPELEVCQVREDSVQTVVEIQVEVHDDQA